MREVSRAWLRTVTSSFTPVFRAVLCTTFQTGSSPIGGEVDVLDGEVRLDGTADVWGSLRLTVPGSQWPQHFGDDRLAPFGNEVYVSAGIKYSDAEIELCGLGYFRTRKLDQDQPHTEGPIQLTGQDRMSTVIRAELLSPRSYPAATLIADFVADLIGDVFPDTAAEFDDDLGTLELGRAVVVERNRYDALKQVAEAHAKLFYFDHRGIPVFVTPPDPEQPVATFAAGTGGTLIAAPRHLSDETVVNAVVANGDGADSQAPAYGVAIDADSSSPTSYYRFGPSPRFLTNSLIRSNDQAYLAALTELQKKTGLAYQVELTVAPRYELQPYDPILAKYAATQERHVLQSVSIPLAPGKTMTAPTRQQSISSFGVSP